MLACWAKLDRDEESSDYHPLLCHMVDVAVVAREMWRSALSPRLRSEAASALGFGEDQDAAGLWCAFLAGLHDLGKASPAFQLQVGGVREEVKRRLQGIELRLPADHGASRPRHGTITAATLPAILVKVFGVAAPVATRLGVVVGGHHGAFPTSSEIREVRSTARGNSDWDAHRLALAEKLAGALGVPRDRAPREVNNATAMILAGFVSVSDWIGSNTDFFRYARPSDLTAYARDTEKRASEALAELGWCLQPRAHGPRRFTGLFPKLTPNDLQRAVESLGPELGAPGLVIIEAPTGEGKTEAAMYLADHWAESTGQQGCYFALPTQATSNQMFGRVRNFLTRRYTGNVIQLQLLHGHAALSSEFQLLRDNHDRTFVPDYIGVDEDAGHQGVVAAEWFTYRKRGLLAPFGVGTIDQALLAALQTRHVFVRLFGLSHKTVIIDEVHAYDAYMTTLLERLLEWLAALGSSVVLLSATLPQIRRQALLKAYERGLGKTSGGVISWERYPRVAWVSASSPPASRAVRTSPLGKKDISVEWTDGSLPAETGGSFPLGDLLRDSLARGGCAAVICNTVRRAQEVYRALKPYFSETADDGEPELDLLHSQYLFEERERRERRSLARFGKPEGTVAGEDGKERPVRRPHRALLVATQVIEQSLDLDFDLMVTEMAPADLLLQRAGRLHRHERPRRPPGLDRPRLLICRPGMQADVPVFDPGTAAVYDIHVLLRSWLALRGRNAIHVPEDVEDIVEEVYDDTRRPDGLSDQLRHEWTDTREKLQKVKDLHRYRASEISILPPTEPTDEILEQFNRQLEEDNPDVHLTLQALTRLSDQTVQVVLVQEHELKDLDGETAIDIPAVRRLLKRSVALSRRGVVTELVKADVPNRWKRSPLLRHHRPLVLNNERPTTLGAYTLSLDPELGVRITHHNEERT